MALCDSRSRFVSSWTVTPTSPASRTTSIARAMCDSRGRGAAAGAPRARRTPSRDTTSASWTPAAAASVRTVFGASPVAELTARRLIPPARSSATFPRRSPAGRPRTSTASSGSSARQ